MRTESLLGPEEVVVLSQLVRDPFQEAVCFLNDLVLLKRGISEQQCIPDFHFCHPRDEVVQWELVLLPIKWDHKRSEVRIIQPEIVQL